MPDDGLCGQPVGGEPRRLQIFRPSRLPRRVPCIDCQDRRKPVRDFDDSPSVGERDAGPDDRQAAPFRYRGLPQLRRQADEESRRTPGEGNGKMSWRVTLRCTRAEAETLPESADLFAQADEPPVIVADEPDPHAPDDWRIHAYFADQPTTQELVLLRRLAANGEP